MLVLLQRTQTVWANSEEKGSSDLGIFVLHWTNSNNTREHTESITTEQLHFIIHYRKKSQLFTLGPAETTWTFMVHGLIPLSWSKWRDWKSPRASEVNKQVGYLRFKLHCFTWHSKGLAKFTWPFISSVPQESDHTQCNMQRNQL